MNGLGLKNPKQIYFFDSQKQIEYYDKTCSNRIRRKRSA